MMRSRIMELFDEDDMEWLQGLIHTEWMSSANDKADAILNRFASKGFIELAPATNRLALMKDGYVFKFALDDYGVDDNNTEFELSVELQPYVTKTYESNGLICVAEYVNLIKESEFIDSLESIRNILNVLAENYVFADVGLNTKNFCNYGFRDDNTIVILDYGYFYRKDARDLFCKQCGSILEYNDNYDMLVCPNCKRSWTPIKLIHENDKLSKHDYSKLAEESNKELIVQLGPEWSPFNKKRGY